MSFVRVRCCSRTQLCSCRIPGPRNGNPRLDGGWTQRRRGSRPSVGRAHFRARGVGAVGFGLGSTLQSLPELGVLSHPVALAPDIDGCGNGAGGG